MEVRRRKAYGRYATIAVWVFIVVEGGELIARYAWGIEEPLWLELLDLPILAAFLVSLFYVQKRSPGR